MVEVASVVAPLAVDDAPGVVCVLLLVLLLDEDAVVVLTASEHDPTNSLATATTTLLTRTRMLPFRIACTMAVRITRH